MEPEAAPSTASSGPRKARSCAICARRKVSCDKQFPCGRCRRAGIRCVPPALDHQPRWARRLEHLSTATDGAGSTSSAQSPAVSAVADKLLDKLRLLEDLMLDLRGDIERARPGSSVGSSQSTLPASGVTSSQTAGADTSTPSAAPRALIDGDRSRDLNSNFWSRVSHELADMRQGTPDDQTDQIEGQDRPGPESSSTAPQSRSRFMFGKSHLAEDNGTSALFPMASQIPFLLEVYAERVHSVTCVPHMPSLKALLRRRQNKEGPPLPAEEEALMFSVFYTAICSLDDEEVLTSFDVPKTKLAQKYREGLEVALTAADFLSKPSDCIVQAILIFLTLARLHETPKYLWMMTGLVIRMARFLRYDEDGASSNDPTPFQSEMRRRTWWNLCALDLRATEDMGTGLAIPKGSHSTSIPSNIDDADLWPGIDYVSSTNASLTATSLLRLCSKVARGTQEMIAMGHTASMEDHIHLLDGLAQELDSDFFSVTDQSRHHAYLAAAGTMRVFLARLTLLAFLPALFASPNADLSSEIRNKLFIAAIEIAELNYALNIHPDCQPWRWVYQTQQHWHAVVYLLIELCRRPWSATMERAWVALQSPWLLPARAASYKNPTVWVPLRKLMNKARANRESEIHRLRNDHVAAGALERHDRGQMPAPISSTTFPMYYDEEQSRQRWRSLLDLGIEVDAAHTPSRLDQGLHGGNVPASGTFTGNNTIQPSLDGLETFFGSETDMQQLDSMEDADFINFDWNSWFTSATDTL